MNWRHLPYDEVWALDFEYIAESGARAIPVCLVAKELIAARTIRLFQPDLCRTPPFKTGRGALFVAFFASAEWSCFAALGWPMPERVIDLYAEFRAQTNGLPLVMGNSLLGALAHHGIPSITSEQKEAGRGLVMRGGPWTDVERREILDYCATDVEPLGPLLAKMLPTMRRDSLGLGRALLRGRYTTAVARMEYAGIPIDVERLNAFRSGWQDIKIDLITDIDRAFGVYDGVAFRIDLFEAYLAREGMGWPRTATGRLQTDQDTFRDMAQTYPQLGPLKELRHALGSMRLEALAVGPDGRNRTLLSPFKAKTGRNAPSTNKFIFGPAVWLRGLIRPAPGQALAYVDWSAQEVAIAAALSGDAALLDAVQSGDPYLSFAISAGLAPPGATKHTHAQIREMCKACLLGANYGMQPRTLAVRSQLSVLEAAEVLRRLRRTFPVYSDWSQNNVDVAILTARMQTVFGWPLHAAGLQTPNSLRNFPMQANGAEMLRLACSLTTEAGVMVCAPVHDALLIEAAADDLAEVVVATRGLMTQAARDVLDGIEVATSVETITYPERYADPRGAVMWQRVNQLLGLDVE